MTTLKRSVVVCVLLSLLAVPALAQPGGQGNGDVDRVQQQDGTCDNSVANRDMIRDCDRVRDCDGTGAQQRGRGRGRGWGRRASWRAAQRDRQNQQLQDMGPLSDPEIEEVLYMRQEEKLARDVYLTFSDTWLADVFETIAASEQRHMDAVGRIIEAQELEDSVDEDTVGAFTDPFFTGLYTDLTEAGNVSYVDALKTGAYIEELDLADLALALDIVENTHLIQVLENLQRGSRNHLRAFVRYLAAEGETYAPQVLPQEDFDEIISSDVERGARRGRQ